jgi:hypothetical protein
MQNKYKTHAFILIIFLLVISIKSNDLGASMMSDSINIETEKHAYYTDELIKVNVKVTSKENIRDNKYNARISSAVLVIKDNNGLVLGDISPPELGNFIFSVSEDETKTFEFFGTHSTLIKTKDKFIRSLPAGVYKINVCYQQNVLLNEPCVILSNTINVAIENRKDYITKDQAMAIATSKLNKRRDYFLDDISDADQFWIITFYTIKNLKFQKEDENAVFQVDKRSGLVKKCEKEKNGTFPNVPMR